MKSIWRKTGSGVVALLALGIAGQLTVTLPTAADTVAPEQLANPDSRFLRLNGVNVHYKSQGEGKLAFVLLHGFAASLFSWRDVMAQLGRLGRVVAFDRPAFGLTERPLPGTWQGQNPYGLAFQPDLTVALMDALGIEKAILIGNSAGGTVALSTALRYPERVQALVLVDAAVYHNGSNRLGRFGALGRTPLGRHLGRFSCALSAVGGRYLAVRPGTTHPGSRQTFGPGTPCL